jgi:UDP-4-amino-4,6-dideoxy-N-acetyl-beta-L-altrosamine N-acetyltransferase
MLNTILSYEEVFFMPGNIVFAKGDYALRRIEEKDLPLILAWRNREDIRRNMLHDAVISREEHAAWFRSLQGAPDKECLLFCLGDKPLGISSLSDLDTASRACGWGFYIGDKTAPRGAGLTMGQLSLDYIFGARALEKIENQVLSFNTRSLAFHRKLFFTETGRRFGKIKRDGILYDIILLELLRSTWLRKTTEAP